MSDPVVTAPDGAFTVGGGGWEQDVTESSVTSLFAVPLFGSDDSTSLFESQLLKLPLDALKSFKPMIPGATDTDFASVGSSVSKILSSLTDGANTILSNLATAVNQLLDILRGLVVTPINEAVAGVKDWFDGLGIDLGGKASAADLAELQSRTDELEGVIGYCHAYVNGSISTTAGDKKLAMTNQIGPKEGVDMVSGSFVLNSKGLWVADAHACFDYLDIGVKETVLFARVYTPGGSLYAERWAIADTDKKHSLSVHLPFTVPTSGYKVEMWANAALGRGIFGGSANNGLSVEKVSSETE